MEFDRGKDIDMTTKKALKASFLIVAAVVTLVAAVAHAAKVGATLSNVKIKDANDKPAWIPGFGKKVLVIFYVDIKAGDDNDPLADALKAKKLDESKHQGMGIVNLKDSWAPNAVIRMMIRKKLAKYGKSVILTDDDRSIPTKWKLGDCDDMSVVLVIGKDKKLKYLKKGPVKGAEVGKVIELIEDEMNK